MAVSGTTKFFVRTAKPSTEPDQEVLMITGMLPVIVLPLKIAWLAVFRFVPVYAPVKPVLRLLSIAACAAARKADEPAM
jgi:hypothetical protein